MAKFIFLVVSSDNADSGGLEIDHRCPSEEESSVALLNAQFYSEFLQFVLDGVEQLAHSHQHDFGRRVLNWDR